MEKTRGLPILLLLSTLSFAGWSRAEALPTPPDEDLPPLLYTYPTQPYEILSPIGAGKKTIPEAKEQLQREAKKVQAEAVIGVKCESGGVRRQGLTWYNQDAYCRGSAIRYRTPATANEPRVKSWRKDFN